MTITAVRMNHLTDRCRIISYPHAKHKITFLSDRSTKANSRPVTEVRIKKFKTLKEHLEKYLYDM